MTDLKVQVVVPAAVLEAIAERAAELVMQRQDTAWLTTSEAAQRLRCTPQRVYDLVHAGTLQPARDGRRLLFDRADLDAYLRRAT